MIARLPLRQRAGDRALGTAGLAPNRLDGLLAVIEPNRPRPAEEIALARSPPVLARGPGFSG